MDILSNQWHTQERHNEKTESLILSTLWAEGKQNKHSQKYGDENTWAIY